MEKIYTYKSEQMHINIAMDYFHWPLAPEIQTYINGLMTINIVMDYACYLLYPIS